MINAIESLLQLNLCCFNINKKAAPFLLMPPGISRPINRAEIFNSIYEKHCLMALKQYL